MKCTIQKADFADIHTDIIRSESIGNGVQKMGYKSRVDWCDSTWSPVTGCLHGCEYCYAKRIAERFGSNLMPIFTKYPVLDKPVRNLGIDAGKIQPYPFDFTPTFHRYRLGEPARWTRPRNIFVCSMADLFGEWVPDAWIREVFEACEAAPQHRYLFLTKNPARYMELAVNGVITKDHSNFWFGSTATTPETPFFWHNELHTFVSIEPILGPFKDLTDDGIDPVSKVKWIIVGAETGNRKNKVTPKASWIMDIVQNAETTNTPVFMKESLRELMGDDFRQEFPWEV